jgi:hypothetical protein
MHGSLLADFAARLAFGMGALLVVTSWRAVPVGFFRTHCQVILGLLVLATLAIAGRDAPTTALAAPIAAAVAAYLASVFWGLGLVRLARPLSALLAAGLAIWLIAVSLGTGGSASSSASLNPAATASASISMGTGGLLVLNRLVSGLLMGSTVSAMLLGHYYLTAPAMSIEPLSRYVQTMGVSLLARAILAGAGLAVSYPVLIALGREPRLAAIGSTAPLFLVVRWGLGFVGPSVATWMAWKTLQIRSTQSATGILYVATTLVFFGEATALILSQDGVVS